MSLQWYVAQTKPNSEYQAQRRLRRQGFITYLPLNTIRRAVRGRAVDRREPLFHGYLFVLMEIDDPEDEHWKSVNGTRAVMGLLPSSAAPQRIDRTEIEEMHYAEHEGYFRSGTVEPGDRLMVFKGHLVGQVLECISSGKDRVTALWDCISSRVVVDVPLLDVTVLR